jgi:hypothetical protein
VSPSLSIERDFILSGPGVSAIESRYAELIPILDVASGACEVDLKQHLGYVVGVFIGYIQVAFERKRNKFRGHPQATRFSRLVNT